jgi:hypothetical protein
MKIQKLLLLSFTHVFMLACGFIIGIYMLPILTAPPSPSASDIKAISIQADYKTEFIRDLKGSDALHWGDGQVSINANYVTLLGKLAPGPNYKLYLSPKFVETEAAFERLKPTMKFVGDVNTFDNFMVKVEPGITLSQYNTVVVWCEAFGEFITSAKYR